MAMDSDQIAELEKLIKKARQKPLAFGLCLGKKPEENVLYLDLKKSPEVVMRRAKGDGDTGKVTCGMVDVKGKIMSLSLEGKMLPGLAKNMKTFMTKQGMKMKVVIMDADGNELESDGDEDTDDTIVDGGENTNDAPNETASENTGDESPDDNSEPESPEDPLAAQWAKFSEELDPLVEKFGASDHKKAAAIVGAWNGAKTAANNGDFKTAMTVVAKVRPVVTASDDNTETTANPDEAKWNTERSAMEPLCTDAMAKNPDNRSKLQAAWGMAIEKADGGDFAGGLNILQRLKPSLEAAAKSETTGQEKEIAKDVVDFQKSRVLWSTTKAKMREGIQRLVEKIVEECNEIDGMEDVAGNAPDLLKRLDVFDEQLETILDAITQTVEGPDREKLKAAAVKKIGEYQKELQSDFFADVDSKNGFTNVSVTSTATASLGHISKVLAA